MTYKQLNYSHRCHIYCLWRAGNNQTEIAKQIGVHKSTISREFKRNITFVRTKLGSWQYKPDYAQSHTEDRHKIKRKRVKFTQEIQTFVDEKLRQDWSPEQISGHAKRHQLFLMSHERIYQYLLKDKEKGGKLYLHLRHQHKKYRKRYGSSPRNGPIKNRVFIDERPKVVDEKARIGDWEIDTIIGGDRKQAIITIVERFSKKTVCKKIHCRKADVAKEAIINALSPFMDAVLTITGAGNFRSMKR